MNLDILSNNLSSHISDVFKNDFLKSLEIFLSNNGKEINMLETAIVDRIENNIAICELSDKTMLNIPLNKFNFEVSETDIVKLNLEYKNGKISNISVISKDDIEKETRQKIINDKFNSLKK